MSGSVIPFVGEAPIALAILINACKPNMETSPTTNIKLYASLFFNINNKLLIIIIKKIKINILQKIYPNSSPATEKIKI